MHHHRVMAIHFYITVVNSIHVHSEFQMANMFISVWMKKCVNYPRKSSKGERLKVVIYHTF